ncbi:CHAP domain-containing protein [Leeia sp. TBRC 13508]|uniref:CHAP domain-containing protein n=1 Tax=Leeia speluncae TaxID=2884804 RepID=A0ABS8D7X1_9NEIS|nr:CHAP domain-containing protein [Leeia speluncae]MCB6184304.1 CHAP domain-containing protein [Leeia speluncae]
MGMGIKALAVAVSQLGVQEQPKGSNWGPEVSGYLKSVGINFAASWCAAFVYWSHDQAAKAMKIANTVPKTGGVLNMWNKSTANRVTVPQPGDVFIMDFGKGLGHTGIVERVEGLNIHTIEGNTNDDGSREGYVVCRRVRSIAKCKGFLRF